jgi:serine/threonine protein kinase
MAAWADHEHPKLLGAAHGLRYLHSQLVIHGDINDVEFFFVALHQSVVLIPSQLFKVNVLVDSNLNAQLADFGLTIVGETSAAGMTTTHSGNGTLRWKSPERLDEDDRRTIAGYIWAFACLCVAVCSRVMWSDPPILMRSQQLYTRDRPFSTMSDARVIAHVTTGGSPPRPALDECHGYAIPDPLWNALERCWRPVPAERPPIQMLFVRLEALLRN